MIDIFSILFPVILLFTAAAMVVLRAGASRVFFDVVGAFQADRLIADVDAKIGVVNSIILDGLSGIGESVGLISDQMQMLVDSTVPLSVEVGEARLEFEKFAATIEGSEHLRQNIIDIGESFGFSAAQAQVAGARMAQLSGVFGGREAIQEATAAGMQFGMIGGMETGDAMQRLIQLHQQTNTLYGDLTRSQFMRMSAEEQANTVRENSARLLDELNTIENRSAATMQHITHVMNQFASSGQLAGDSISYMAAMSATLIEAGEEQGKAGRALRMMYARLGANTGENAEILGEFGIATKDAEGNLRSMEDIMRDITRSSIMNSEADKLRVAQAIAGNDHYVRALKLMNNHSRAIDLNTQAQRRLDSATEESNKKLQDQVYQLKIAEAELMNAKAAVGDALLPFTIMQTKAQTRMNQGFADMVNTDAGKFMMELTFGVQQMVRAYAPLGEALLNIMSLNVSLQTQATIMRALSGEEIVRASAYGGRNVAQKESLALMDSEIHKLDRIARLENVRAQMTKTRQLQLAQTNLQQNIIDSNEMARLQQRSQQMTQGLQQELQGREKVNLLNIIGTQQEQDQAKAQFQTLTALDSEIVALHKIKTLEDAKRVIAGEMLSKGKYVSHQKQQELGYEQSINRVINNGLFLKNNEARINDVLVNNAALINLKSQERAQILQNNINLYQLNEQVGKQRIATYNTEIAVIDGLIRRQGMHILAENMMGRQTQQTTQGQAILNLAYLEGITILGSKDNAQVKTIGLESLATSTAMKLAGAYKMEATAVREIIMQMPMFIALQDALTNSQDKQFNSQMALNGAYMKTSLILGGMSMMFTMFGDSQESARAGMILMMMSMVPMTIQMFQATSEATRLGLGILGVGQQALVAAPKVGILAKSLNALTSATGIGLLLTGLAVGIAYFTDFGEAADDAESDMGNFAQTVAYTNDQFQNIEKTVEGLTLEQLYGQQAQAQADVKQMEEELEDATDSTNRKLLEARLKARREDLSILTDIMNMESSMSLIGPEANKTLARQIYQAGQEYSRIMDDIDDRLADAIAEEDNEFYEDWEFLKDLGEVVVPEDMERVGKIEKEKKEALEDLEEMIGEKVPDAYQGFVLAQAKAASSFDDFISRIADIMELDDLEGFGDGMAANVIGPIEAAKAAAFEFANAREEMFFGMAKGNITGDMVKQVVNKGVETLINTTEVIMTNHFNGMTTQQAADQIIGLVEVQLAERGLTL